MKFEKKVQANFDEHVLIEVFSGTDRVYLEVDDNDGERQYVILSIPQAKKVRKALKKAIKKAGQP